MALRIPPGRAGRIWLAARLETASRGAELLDRKRQALIREQLVANAAALEAHRAWVGAASDAALWGRRTAILDGPGRIQLLARHVRGEASVQAAWSNVMGARIPRTEGATTPEPPPLSALGGSVAVVIGARACRAATEAAARYAVARRAETELTLELARTARRLRALEQRWIPEYQQALARLDIALDENHREQAARARWISRRERRDGW